MSDHSKTTRRLFLGSTVAASSILAGCSGNGGDSSEKTPDKVTDAATETSADTATETVTETNTETEEPTDLENFSYPAGASQGGVVPEDLFSAHRSRIIDGGSATVTVQKETDYGHSTPDSYEATRKFASGGILMNQKLDPLTENLWSDSNENAGYVEMDTGFEQKYRIDNQAPEPSQVLRLQFFNYLLTGAQWSEAKEVGENQAGQPIVKYESTGVENESNLLRVLYGNSVSDFTATIYVAESGIVSRYSYSISTEADGQTRQKEGTERVGKVGETSVEKPSWVKTAKETGLKIKLSATDDKKAIKLDVLNGEVPKGARIQLSSDRFESTSISQSLTAGDTLYLAFSESSDLIYSVNEAPKNSTELGEFAFASIRDDKFRLFEDNIRL